MTQQILGVIAIVVLLYVLIALGWRRKNSWLWPKLLNRRDVLILDTETTGLGTKAEVIEVVVIDTTGRCLFESLSLPRGPVSSRAYSLHGLSRERLEEAGAPAWSEIHKDLMKVLRRASCVLAWNAPFDRKMLRQTAKRAGWTLPELPWHDLLADYRILRPDHAHSLAMAAEQEGTIASPTHRARGDCETVLAVMRAMAQNS